MRIGIGLGIGFQGGGGPAPTTLTIETFLVDGTFTRPTLGQFWEPTTGAVSQCYGDVLGSGAGGVTAVGSGAAGGRSGGIFTPGATEAVTVPASSAATVNGADCSIGVHLIAKGGTVSAPGVAGVGGQASAGTGTRKTSGGNGTLSAGSANAGGAAGNVTSGSTLTGGTHNGANGGIGTGTPPGVGGGSQAANQLPGGRAEAMVAYKAVAPVGYARIADFGFWRSSANGTSHAISLVNAFDGAALSFAGKTICVIVTSDGGSGSAMTEASSDWDQLAQVNLSTTVSLTRFEIFNAVGDETLTVATSGSEKINAHIFVIEDAGGLSEWDAPGTGTSNSPNPAPTTPAGGLGKYLSIAIAALDGGVNPGITAGPAGYGNLVTTPHVSSDGVELITSVAYVEGTTIDPGVYTAVNTPPWIGATLCFPPLA